jgi:crotonobetainyl-CoA:carnitine CoA-transferase CaiB-like acyl-CoA transferase
VGPLKGIKVLDLSRVLAGPWATQALADFGALVYKVEKPGTGDDTRSWGPPWLKDANGEDSRESAYYLSTNRGKHSLAIDLAAPDGQRLIRELARRCDVLVENFKVGGLAKYGLAYADLAADNPRLIYCSISAFGQDGPEAQGAGYDAMIQGMGGLMSITGPRGSVPGAGPQKVGVAVADLMTGMYATTAILAALFERTQSGRGQYIDLALLDTQVAVLANQNMSYLLSGRAPGRAGNDHPNIVPYGSFPTADGYMMLAIGNDGQFGRFAELAGRPELARDARFLSNSARVINRDALAAEIAALLSARTTREWIARLAPAAVPCGPINDIAQVFAEPQVRHRGMRIDVAHPLAGSLPQVKNPINFSRTPLEYRLPPPMLGEHTAAVLGAELGLDAAALGELRARGVVG